MRLLLTILLSIFFYQSSAQSDCACCTEQHKQFDFWLGDWQVLDTSGKQVGENTILKVEDNCIMTERWRSSSGSTGRSINFYDKTDNTWNQVWIDNKGGVLRLKGTYQNGSMVLKSERQKGKSGTYYYNQISWSLNNDKTVTQLWEIYNTQGKLLSTAFKGIYHQKNKK